MLYNLARCMAVCRYASSTQILCVPEILIVGVQAALRITQRNSARITLSSCNRLSEIFAFRHPAEHPAIYQALIAQMRCSVILIYIQINLKIEILYQRVTNEFYYILFFI